jgi:hypothetical protein
MDGTYFSKCFKTLNLNIYKPLSSTFSGYFGGSKKLEGVEIKLFNIFPFEEMFILCLN